MKKEYSYGAVVLNKAGLVLIEHMALGHTSLPKGHIEAGETPKECALREIKEETGLCVNLDMSFQASVCYWPQPDVFKEVTFFLASYASGTLTPQKEEVNSLEWVSFEKALQAMTYGSDKEVLQKAKAFLEKGKRPL